MNNKYNSVRRILHRATEEIYSTFLVSCNTSIWNFFKIIKAKALIYKINRRGTEETKEETRCLLEKHHILLEYFRKKYDQFIKEYEFDMRSIPKDSSYKNKIWICWWQGIDHAPELVKKCVHSICENAKSYEVIVLDDSNYKKYVNIPDWLEEKRRTGIITKTHFSDFLRLELLAEHGGIWLDATFFAKNMDFTKIFELPVWTIKRPNYGHLSVACGFFANYSFGCNFENRKVFGILRDYLIEYWKKNSMMIDYLFLDYLIVLAIKHNEYVKRSFEQIPNNNPQCDELQKKLGKPYDRKTWKELLEITGLFKLSWKQAYPSIANNRDTFYGMLIKELL